MMQPRDKEFPKLTVKQADFYRAWQKKCAEKGGERPKYNEIEGYLSPNACEYVRILIRKGFLAESLQTPFRKSDAEFPDIGERSANALRFIKKYIAENGIAPSVKEISGHATPGVTYGVHESIARLVRAGYIQKQPKISRGIRLTERAFPEKTASFLNDLALLNESNEDLCKRIVTDPSPEVGLHAAVGDVELTVNTRTGAVVLRHKDGTRLALKLPPGDPIHRKAAFADLLWILRSRCEMTAIRHVKAFTRQIPVYPKEDIDKRIEAILNNFPFDSVGKVMTALNWTWRGEVGPPTENEMRDAARRLLKQAAEMHPNGTTPRTISTGGFRASRGNSGVLRLEFVAAEQYDTYCDEDTEGNPAAPGFTCVSLRGPRKEKSDVQQTPRHHPLSGTQVEARRFLIAHAGLDRSGLLRRTRRL